MQKLKNKVMKYLKNSTLKNKDELEDLLDGWSDINLKVRIFIEDNDLNSTWVLIGKLLLNKNKISNNIRDYFKNKDNYFILKIENDLSKLKKLKLNEIESEVPLGIKKYIDNEEKKNYILEHFTNYQSAETLVEKFHKYRSYGKKVEAFSEYKKIEKEFRKNKCNKLISLDKFLDVVGNKKTVLKNTYKAFNLLKDEKQLQNKIINLKDKKIRSLILDSKDKLIKQVEGM